MPSVQRAPGGAPSGRCHRVHNTGAGLHRPEPAPQWATDGNDACSRWTFRSWALGGAHLYHNLCAMPPLARGCALTCCCANLSLHMPLSAGDADGCAALATAKRHHQHKHCGNGGTKNDREDSFKPISPPPPPAPRPAAPLDWMRKYTVKWPLLGHGFTGVSARVRFKSTGFECAVKEFRHAPGMQEDTARSVSKNEAHVQRIAAAVGVAPEVYHYALADYRNASLLFSELMVRRAWDNESTSCATDRGRARAVSTCAEMQAAMSALDVAGVLHRDLKLEHFMRNADGRLRILDYAGAIALRATRQRARDNSMLASLLLNGSSTPASSAPSPTAIMHPPRTVDTGLASSLADCMHGANLEDFVEYNACFHTAASMISADEDGAPHRLVEHVEGAPARAIHPGGDYYNPLPEPFACFASECFPKFVREARRTQRRRSADYAQRCLEILRSSLPYGPTHAG